MKKKNCLLKKKKPKLKKRKPKKTTRTQLTKRKTVYILKKKNIDNNDNRNKTTTVCLRPPLFVLLCFIYLEGQQPQPYPMFRILYRLPFSRCQRQNLYSQPGFGASARRKMIQRCHWRAPRYSTRRLLQCYHERYLQPRPSGRTFLIPIGFFAEICHGVCGRVRTDFNVF